jgi:Holliday junction resolvase
MRRKLKGINAERALVKMFWEKGWAAVRTPASGAARFPCPDVIASNKVRMLAIECKTSRKSSKYLQNSDLDSLRGFSSVFGAEPWIGVRFNNQDWFFINLEDLRKTNKGFSITLDSARKTGVLFEELLFEK